MRNYEMLYISNEFVVLISNVPESFHFILQQGSTITIKLPYVIMYACRKFDIRDVRGQLPKSKYQA